nr:MAG TPA: PhTx neurotoxin family [Caudoviricetes sp.]
MVMSRKHRYQCTYSRCSAFFKNGKIYEFGAALVDAKDAVHKARSLPGVEY